MSRRGFLTSTLHYCEQRSQIFFASNPNVLTAMVIWCKRLFATGILLFVSVTAVGQAFDPSDLITERPDPPGTATAVDVAIYLLDVDAINDVTKKNSASTCF